MVFKRSNREKNLILFYEELTPHATHTPYEWAHLYANPHFKTAFGALLAHYKTDEREQLIKEHHKREKTLHDAIYRIKKNNPIVKAEHLKKAGIAPGPEMGKLLHAAEKIAINEGIDDPTTIIRRLFR